MPLVQCPECKKFFNSARGCPVCSSLNRDKNQSKKKRSISFFLKIFMCLIIPVIVFEIMPTGKSSNSQLLSFQPEPYEIMSPRELFNDFYDNEVLAENKYKNKNIALQGIVYSIKNSSMDYPEVVFDIEYGIQTVECQFSKNNHDAISLLKKGQTVTLIGKIKFFNLISLLILEDCTLAKNNR